MTRMCGVEGCGKPILARGYCSMHYDRWRKHGDPHVGGRPERGVCSIEGCDEPHSAKGYCRFHYQKWWRHGNPEYKREPRICCVDGCDRPMFARGHCHKHYDRLFVLGWENPEYTIIKCVDCGVGVRAKNKSTERCDGCKKEKRRVYMRVHGAKIRERWSHKAACKMLTEHDRDLADDPEALDRTFLAEMIIIDCDNEGEE